MSGDLTLKAIRRELRRIAATGDQVRLMEVAELFAGLYIDGRESNDRLLAMMRSYAAERDALAASERTAAATAANQARAAKVAARAKKLQAEGKKIKEIATALDRSERRVWDLLQEPKSGSDVETS